MTPPRGTSLVELIVVLLLLALLMGAVIPSPTAVPKVDGALSPDARARELAVRTGRPSVTPARDSIRGVYAFPDGRVVGEEGADAR